MVLKDGYTWPDLEDDRPGAVEITYVAGYGDNASDVPEDLRTALRFILADWYENRGDQMQKRNEALPIPKQAHSLAWQYRVFLAGVEVSGL